MFNLMWESVTLLLKNQFKMLIMFPHIFMTDTKIFLGYNFRTPLKFIDVWRNPKYICDNPCNYAQ